MKWNQFICPIDEKALIQSNSTLRCENGHSFDIAREGYCNLLLVQQKTSLEPGDSNGMVMARRRFLETGLYLPIAQKVTTLVQELAKKSSAQKNTFRVLDAGSGEGYYLRHLHTQNPEFELIGIDISKAAVKAAAKLSPQISWAVASNKQLPIEPASIDLILCMFGFPVWRSFAKVQKKGDHVILVDAAENHLIELRQIIYPTVTKSAVASIEAAFSSGYQLMSEERLTFSIQLKNPEQIADLLAMTPHAYRASEPGLKKLSEIQQLEVSVDLCVRMLRLLNE